MKNILVAGGAGFIGSHLCEYLLKHGDRVVCVDNFSTSSEDNIKSFERNKLFKFVRHDIIDPLYLDEPIDEIYNLACPASPVHYQKSPIRTIKANTIGVINLLGLAKSKKAKILQASTSEVYGEPLVSPQAETYRGNVNPIGPRACYDEGKRCAETLFFDYHRFWGLKIKVARVFNTYGPRMAENDGRVVSNFISQALRQNDITIYGDGSQTRSFCFVDDLVDGLIRVMDSDDKLLGPVNLGNPEEITINELASRIKKIAFPNTNIVYHDLPVDDPTNRCPDITLAKNTLGWKPVISLDKGLVKTVDYFKSKL